MIPTRYINPGPLAAPANPGPAMAAGKALEQVGGALESVGEAGMDLMGKVRRIEEQGKINAFMTQADEEAGRFAIGLAQRSDTDAWPQEWKDKTAALRDQAGKLGLSPEGAAHLDNEFSSWSSTRAIHFETQAATKKLGIARAQTTQALQYYAGRGDKEGFDRTLATATFLDPAEREKAQMHFNETAAANDLQRMVETNPQSVLDAETDSLLKRLPGASLELIDQAKRSAKSAVRERSLDLVDAASDDIYSGKVTSERQIDEDPRYAGLRPTVREKLKDGLRSYQIQQAEGLRNTPEAQAEVVGRVSSLLGEWEPKAETDADLKYAEIQGLIGRLPDGAMKAELSRQAKAIRAGTWAEATTHAEAAQKALDEAHKAGRFGKVPEVTKIPLKKMIDDGFLKDSIKLQRLGFSKSQADQITTLHADPAAAQKKFTELWKDREKGSVNASPAEIAIADAIRLGHAETPFTDAESEDAAISARLEAERRYGAAKQRLAEWIRLNPDARPEQIEDQIQGIAGEEEIRKLKSGIYERKDASPKGAAADTAAVPVGKNLTEIVKNFEAADGFHRAAYWDYGQWSIGYGTKAKEGETIDQEEADRRLASELGSARAEVEAEAKRVGLALRPNELDALTSFQFNTGKISALLAGGKRGKAEIAETMLLYRNADGQRLRGLERRRAAERALFLSGYGNS